MLDSLLEKKLRERESKQLLRQLTTVNGLIDFTSNDYLGLAASTELFQLIDHSVKSQGVRKNGSGGSRLLSGNSELAENVESRLADIFQAESALLFNSGYTANLAVLSSIPRRDDTIIYDELAHSCIKDGARLSLAKRLSFKHNDLNDLENKMRKASGKLFIVVESIYSMDGDCCPLKELVPLTEKYNATIILDEAHSTGVMGQNGNGLSVSARLHERIGVRIYTFGKAMGVHGACVAGSKILRQYLINFARPFVYTTALPPHSVTAIDCAFNYLRQNISLQRSLVDLTHTFLNEVSPLTNRTQSVSSIQTIIIPGNGNTIAAAKNLQDLGFDVRPILSPTVPEGSERLRICLHTFNTTAQVKDLAKELKQLARSDFKV
ncbi:MAG TPA: 8-amino-7-oxononanoate synthase [Chryseolinea sp.]|nr:8-amino-7-oxononanoate synthase [Chryseolinea sp.]